MKILLLNQAFYPDVVSTAQHAGDLCARLAGAGHEVNVIASQRAYDDFRRSFPRKEVWNGVKIRRIPSLGLGKRALWRRVLDFAWFHFCCMLQLARSPKFDVVIAMTTPPMIGFVSSFFVRYKGGQLVYWVMDLNPDEAVAAGMLNERSVPARILQWMLHSTLRRSSKVIALDRFMQARLLAKGVDASAVTVVPPWSHDQSISYDAKGRAAFRQEHGLEGKFVVMYSGNHSPCHPLDTLMGAALQLAGRPDIAFCFVGGGTEHARVGAFASQHGLSNVLCLPYQPIERLSASLASADLQAVVMGDAFVGIVHPCKIYNILLLGIPVLYVGPSEGHIPDLVPPEAHSTWFYSVRHGQVDTLVNHIRAAASNSSQRNPEQVCIAARFSTDLLVTKLVTMIETLGPQGTRIPVADVIPSTERTSA